MNDFQELRNALLRLKMALQQAMGSLDHLHMNLHELAWRVYREHCSPFGETEGGLKIWLEYEQFTTKN